MIEEFKDSKGAFIKYNDGIAIELRDFEIRDLFTDLTELIVKWDKSKAIGNKTLTAFSDFTNHVIVRVGDEEFGMNVFKALKLWKDLENAIKNSIE